MVPGAGGQTPFLDCFSLQIHWTGTNMPTHAVKCPHLRAAYPNSRQDDSFRSDHFMSMARKVLSRSSHSLLMAWGSPERMRVLEADRIAAGRAVWIFLYVVKSPTVRNGR